ncbi:protein Niban 1a isoform X1 [Seriola aureovittata]|uniref:protein Niban 1a isoform X1 n=1 Tax=Seriola aureovittata TaxID=2871759 RepID=UPI0024BEF42F|nr:protein Niban 1a isoform X1 [Seriola aureovittata]
MGVSASSLLDDNKSTYIKGQAEAELNEFSPYYRKQFSVAQFSQVEDDLEQHKEKITQLLKQREAPQEAEVLYEEGVFYFDDTRKWRERYVVVRANYCLECHESLESFVKGVPPRHKLLPTGGTVLTTEERYMAMVDRCFPDDTNVKEDFAPPLSGMPGQFPVYLRLPYRRDSYFCFRQQAKQDAFLSIMSDCIRHQNQDFLKKKTCEVQAFLKAIQLYRQVKGKYEAWDMLIGSDVRVMANVVMEQLLPSLEKDMLPRLKAKKTEKKRVWFATVEAAYILIQEHLLEGLSALKEECRTSVRQQEVTIHSDMDQILNSRRQLEEKVRAKVSEPAEKLCSESVQPYLGSVLEELMEPISSGFHEGRQLSENMMDQVCQDFLVGRENERLKKALADMSRLNLQSCYQKIGSLQEKLQHLQERFAFSNITGVIHSAQIDLQLLMENAAYTFEQLLHKAVQDNPDNAGSAIEKAKHRVLKQYDYDSSTVRKRIFQDALVSITLPFIKRNLAPTCKTELQDLEQSIYSDHSNFIHVENVYEGILLQTLDKEVTKVVKEAASLKKYNLFTDSRDLISQSSRSSLSSPSVSTPGSPAMALASPSKTSFEPQPPSPLVVNGLSSSPLKGEQQEKENGVLPGESSADMTVIETPLGKVEQKEIDQSVAVSEEEEIPAPVAEEVIQTVKAEEDATVALEAAALIDTPTANGTQEVNVAAAPETVTQEEVISVKTEKVELAAEPETQSTDALKEAEVALEEVPTVVESLKTDAKEAAEQTEAPEPSPDPSNEAVPASAVETSSQPVTSSDEDRQCESSEVKSEAPSGGEAPVVTSGDVGLDLEGNKAEPVPVSDPNPLDVSGGSESHASDVESTEEVKVTQSSQDEVSTTSDVLEDEAIVSKSPVSSEDAPEDKSTSSEPSPQTQKEDDTSCDVSVGGDMEAGASVNVEATSPSPGPDKEETPSSPEARPQDCIKDIRDLVVEVIEVEELMQHYPSGVPKDE